MVVITISCFQYRHYAAFPFLLFVLVSLLVSVLSFEPNLAAMEVKFVQRLLYLTMVLFEV